MHPFTKQQDSNSEKPKKTNKSRELKLKCPSTKQSCWDGRNFVFVGQFFLYSGIFEIWLYSLFRNCIVCLLMALVGLSCVWRWNMELWSVESFKSRKRNPSDIDWSIGLRISYYFRNHESFVSNLAWQFVRMSFLGINRFMMKTRRRIWRSIEIITHFMLDPFQRVRRNIRN